MLKSFLVVHDPAPEAHDGIVACVDGSMMDSEILKFANLNVPGRNFITIVDGNIFGTTYPHVCPHNENRRHILITR